FILIVVMLWFAGCGVSSRDSWVTTPMPTVTVALTQETTDIPTPTVAATDTPAPTQVPSATDTPAPTQVPAATDTPVPTQAPAATDTPVPTEVPTLTPIPVVKELSYVLSDDGTYYSVAGAGTFDGDELLIPSVYNGLPVLRIMPKAFEGCSFLKKVSVAEGVTEIGNGAFLNCSGLEYVSLPDSIASFGNFVFQSCKELKKAELPDGIKDIPDSTFAYCKSFLIDIPESVETIQMRAYMGCAVDGELVIPENVTVIEKHAFKDITGITGLTINSVADLLRYGSFEGIDELETLTAPCAVVGSSFFYQMNVAKKTFLTDGVDSRWDGARDDFRYNWGYVVCKKHDEQFDTGGACAGLYERLYKAIEKREKNVLCTGTKGVYGFSVYKLVRDDHPEFGAIVKEATINNGNSLLQITYIDSDESAKLLAECRASLEEIRERITEKYGSVEKASRVQRVKEIHDYIVLKKEYLKSEYDQTIVGALSNDYTPVCAAYSAAFKWCCDELGIQCEMVYGDVYGSDTPSHVWNMIRYGEPEDYLSGDYKPDPSEWYEMDVTWDDPLNGAKDYISYDYFNVITAVISKSRKRTYDVYASYPVVKCTGNEYGYLKCMESGIFERQDQDRH
ncbi:MAG: leucine-rich repeat protein, partial [Lachnospiraceae bacterium]|nr:leucine-rich repeat protein [Lachnospiraceae bacterium]